MPSTMEQLLTLPDVDSRSGILYCQMCDDLVWDPTFEELRIKKIGTGSFSGIHAALVGNVIVYSLLIHVLHRSQAKA